MRIGVFPGTFDPFTIGHTSIIDRGLLLFDELHIAIGVNDTKKTFFSLDKRLEWIDRLYGSNNRVKIASYNGLTVDYCKKSDSKFILRGLRSFEDFEYEKRIAMVNKELNPEIESIFLYASAEFGAVSSSFVREILRAGGKIDSFVPNEISSLIYQEFRNT